jgi:hypothetical protein
MVTQDNLAAHMTLELVNYCRENQIHLVNFPAKTTHLLQPLDALFNNLKAKFANIARRAQLANPSGIVNKNNFSGEYFF